MRKRRRSQIGLHHRGIPLGRAWRAGENPAAGLDHAHPIAQLPDQREIVLDQHDETAGLRQPANERCKCWRSPSVKPVAGSSSSSRRGAATRHRAISTRWRFP